MSKEEKMKEEVKEKAEKVKKAAEDAVEKMYRNEYMWRDGRFGENPEAAYIRKETRDEMLALLDHAEAARGRLVVDEAFIHYCIERSVADLAAVHPALIVLGSLTKVLAIPGVRLGYMIAHPHVINLLYNGLLPWRLNCVADAVAAALPGHGDDFEGIRRLNQARREAFAGDLRALGIKVYPSEANFLLCDFGRDMRPTIEELRQGRILVRPCGMFPGLTDGHVRLCVRTEAENARLVEALRGTLSP